ncbi:MAG: hypothetical protein ACREIT_01325 [Tepidisphaeraceae bacterium]
MLSLLGTSKANDWKGPVNASLVTQDVIRLLEKRYGRSRQSGKGRILNFGPGILTCSLNYSKLLHGYKYFFALPNDVLGDESNLPAAEVGAFVILICGSIDRLLVLPRELMVDMMTGVTTRRVDVFVDGQSYILQTTKHPKLDVTRYINAFPVCASRQPAPSNSALPENAKDRLHLKVQWGLIALGRAEGCSVWVPGSDRNLAVGGRSLADATLPKLPQFGFDENTRRIVENIDVLWLNRNVIRKAFEIESTTSIYSGLLRLNDLTLAQPNNQIELYIAAGATRRNKVHAQLTRPSFQSLLQSCRFVSFEEIEDHVKKINGLPVHAGARVTGLLAGEKFPVPEHFVYPSNL